VHFEDADVRALPDCIVYGRDGVGRLCTDVEAAVVLEHVADLRADADMRVRQ
jgi:hypothetical protein